MFLNNLKIHSYLFNRIHGYDMHISEIKIRKYKQSARQKAEISHDISACRTVFAGDPAVVCPTVDEIGYHQKDDPFFFLTVVFEIEKTICHN